MVNLPKKVEICECWPRDGIQGEPRIIPAETKIEMIDQLARAGFTRMEVTSFSHPKLVKQFADAVEVLKGIDRSAGVSFIAIVPNEKALDRVLDCCQAGYGVDEITAIISASEAHLLANLERTMAEVKPSLARIVTRAHQEGLKVIGCIGTAFGCPLAGEVPLKAVEDLIDWYLDLEAEYIMLGDTTGEANPIQVREVYGRMRERYPEVKFIAHFHDTRGMGLANTLAALEQGVTYHDGSLGGIGGQPATNRPKYHYGLTGNTCTEDMVVLMDELGVATGLDAWDVIELSRRAEQICGRELLGHSTRSGPVRHRAPRELDPVSLRVGRFVPPSLYLFSPEAEAGFDDDAVAGRIVRAALDVNWPLPEQITLDTAWIELEQRPDQRAVLLTRFTVAEVDDRRAVLEALCQKSDGQVLFAGPVEVTVA
jgi:hydroxymethylglutaryl-CoA lyase